MIIRYDANMVKEHQFEYEPAIERRAACNYVGLKVLPLPLDPCCPCPVSQLSPISQDRCIFVLQNAGATCYMNSVIQQLYAVPTVTDQLLGVEIEQEEEGWKKRKCMDEEEREK